MGVMTDEIGEIVDIEVKQANDTSETYTFVDNESIININQRNKMEGTDTGMKELGMKVRLSADVHNNNIAQKEVMEDERSRIKSSDLKSDHLVNNQSVNTLENCNSSQAITDVDVEDMNHEDIIGGVQLAIKKIGTNSDLSVDRTCPLEEEIKLLNLFIQKIFQ